MMWAYGVLVGVICSSGNSYPSGAPESTCWTMFPKHSETTAQIGPSPFLIDVTPETYEPGENITLTITAPTQETFKGILVRAHRQDGNTEEFVGQFVSFPANKVKVFTCFGGYKNIITHRNSNEVKSISLIWRAPMENVGNITFRATVVQDYVTFWQRVEVEMFVSTNISNSVVPSIYQALETLPMTNEIDFSGCGSTKGCFLYPRFCTGHDCIAAMTYHYHPETENFFIEMLSTVAENYIGLGFSKDKHMGNDETYICVNDFSGMSVQHGYNPNHHNERLMTMNVSDMKVRYADGILQCMFVIPKESFVHKVIQNSSSLTYDSIAYNHEEKWYLQLAWGETIPDTDVIKRHNNPPAQTDDLVDLKKIYLHRGSSFHWLVKAHAAVMIVAWVFIGGIVTVMPRHYKDWLPTKILYGTKIWFQIHRGLAVTIVVLTATGLAFIFAHYGPEIRKTAIPHAYVGLTVTAALVVQATAGFLRPNPSHKMRIFYNWGHRILGQITHILAAVTMFLAFEISYMTKEMHKFGFTALGIWVIMQVLWHIGFEIVRCRRQSEPKLNQVSEASSLIIEAESEESMSKLGSVMLAVYIISLAALCIATLLTILLN